MALYYASVAAEGGRTLLASGNHVYNAIAATRPQLLDVLAKDWAIDTYVTHLFSDRRASVMKLMRAG